MNTNAMVIPAVLCLAALSGPGSGSGDGERRTLDLAVEVQGIPCQRGHAWFDAAGRLTSCALSRAATIRGAELPSGSWVSLRSDGALEYVFLPGDTRIQGHLCRGQGHDFMTTFHPGGALELCWLAEAEQIQGVPCGRATFIADVFGGGAGTYFHENGKLAGCKLSRDATLEGRPFRRGDHVRIDPNGKLVLPD